jgi:hypothetical protein
LFFIITWFLLKERKNDFIARRMSGFIFSLEIVFQPQEKRVLLFWIL